MKQNPGDLLNDIFKAHIDKYRCYSDNGQKEIKLFKILLESLDKMKIFGLDVHVIGDKIHQVYTWFDVCNAFCYPINNSKRRELADLVFITYSNKLKTAKITFLQSKHQINLINNKLIIFDAEIFQFYLLKYKPIVIKSKYYLLENDKKLLNNAKIESITGYNVFYNDFKHKNYDMTYYSTEFLNINEPFQDSKKRQNGKVEFGGCFNKVNLKYSTSDVEGTPNLVDFGNNLFDLKIGDLIDTQLKKSIEAQVLKTPQSFKDLILENTNDFMVTPDYISGQDFSDLNLIFINSDEKLNGLFDNDQVNIVLI